MKGTIAVGGRRIRRLRCAIRGRQPVTRRAASICGHVCRVRAVGGGVRWGRFVPRPRAHRRRALRGTIVGWKGCIKCLGLAAQGTTAQAQTAERAEALPDRMGATRGGGLVRQASSVRRGRLNRARVRAAPFRGRRGTETSRIASLARRGTIARLRT